MAKWLFETSLPNLSLKLKHSETRYDAKGRRYVSPGISYNFNGVYFQTDSDKDAEAIRASKPFKDKKIWEVIKQAKESPPEESSTDEKKKRGRKKKDEVPKEVMDMVKSDGS